MSSSIREVSKLVASVWDDFEIKVTKKGHFMVTLRSRKGTELVTVSGTPSDHRVRKNITGDLRRAIKRL